MEKEDTGENLDDLKITTENMKFLSLTESPLWGIFVRLVEDDIKELDSISSLVISQSREELIREIEVRAQVIDRLKKYIGVTISRAESALIDTNQNDYDIINVRN